MSQIQIDPAGAVTVRPQVRGAFIVGCPRSGTTLLQAMLAQNQEVYSFPETHFFRKVWGRMWDRRSSGIVSPRAAAATLDSLVKVIDLTARPRVPRSWPLFGAYANAFVSTVELACSAHGKSLWVEKSPVHLHCVDPILGAIPGAKFVHILRDGRDVATSIFELCLADPARWVGQVMPHVAADVTTSEAGKSALLDAIARRWNDDIRLSESYRADPRHHILTYEGLIDAPEIVLKELCSFLELDYDDRMLRHWESARTVVGFRSRASHMQKPFEPLQSSHLKKFNSVLTAEERNHLEGALSNGGRLDGLE